MLRYVKLGLMVLMAALYFVAGVNHFRNPDFYLAIMPLYIPGHAFWVAFTGVAEILGAIGLLLPATRRWAAWGIVAMLVGFFLVHVDMIIHAHDRFESVSYAFIIARIPIQFVLIAWAWWYTFPAPEEPNKNMDAVPN